jgi:hypothetical protein
MAPLKNRQSHRPPAVGRRGAGSAGAHHVEAVGGGFGRFLLCCKASAVLSTSGARIMSYSEGKPDKNVSYQISDQSALI